jgi:hypothetical protein
MGHEGVGEHTECALPQRLLPIPRDIPLRGLNAMTAIIGVTPTQKELPAFPRQISTQ